MTSIQERVEAGAAWLDANRPGWVDRINLETLDLGDECGCVLGQEFGEWYVRPDEVRPHEVEFGFQRDESGDDDVYIHALTRLVAEEYAELTHAWRDLITARRAAA